MTFRLGQSRYLTRLRLDGRERAWDKGCQRNLRPGVGKRDMNVVEPPLSYWKALPPERITDISRNILIKLEDGYCLPDAASWWPGAR